ncbi:MAG: flagellar hook-associated protein FlgK [Gemmatimonadales bacterium]
MSLTSFLSIARSAMVTHQRAMDVTAHNVANAQTPGYSRQRLDLAAAVPLLTPGGAIGRGVTAEGISRARDQFFDSAFRRESGLLGTSTTLRDFLGRVEAAINEPSDTGLASALDGLFGSFADLAADPTNPVARGQVAQKANSLIQQFHRLDATITAAMQDVTSQLSAQVSEANGLARQIADLNTRLLSAGGSGGSADLADQRDVAIDRLSQLGAVRVLERNDGTVGVLFGDAMLVDGGLANTLTVVPAGGGGVGVGLAGGGAVDPQAGSLKALNDLSTTTLPGIRAQLDALAQGLVMEVNAVHQTGYNALGATGVDFFDPAGTTAATIGLSVSVQASPDAIATGAGNAPGDAAVALQLSQLGGTAVPSLSGRTLRDFYIDLASAVGTAVSDANQNASTQQTLVDRADAQRSSVSGVSIDEEMVTLIGQQHAFGAAARLVQVASEMMDDVLQMVR